MYATHKWNNWIYSNVIIGFIHLLLEKNEYFRSEETRPALSTKYPLHIAKWTLTFYNKFPKINKENSKSINLLLFLFTEEKFQGSTLSTEVASIIVNKHRKIPFSPEINKCKLTKANPRNNASAKVSFEVFLVVTEVYIYWFYLFWKL
mgnify:CR=1 FL=1